MEESGYVIKNNFYKNMNAYYGKDGNFTILLKAETFSDIVACQNAILKICHTYKEVEAYNRENLEMKKVTVKIID